MRAAARARRLGVNVFRITIFFFAPAIIPRTRRARAIRCRFALGLINEEKGVNAKHAFCRESNASPSPLAIFRLFFLEKYEKLFGRLCRVGDNKPERTKFRRDQKIGRKCESERREIRKFAVFFGQFSK